MHLIAQLLVAGVLAHAKRLVVERQTSEGTAPPCSLPEELLTNGNFSSGLDSWHAVQPTPNASVALVPSSGIGTGAAVRFTITEHSKPKPGPSIWQGPVGICPYMWYELTLDYNVVSANQYCALVFNVGHSPNHGAPYISGIPPPLYLLNTGRGEYRYNISGDYLHLAYFSVGITCTPNTPGPPAPGVIVEVDNLATRAVGTNEPAGCPRSDIALLNGGFENKTIAPWEVTYKTPTAVNYSLVAPGYESAQMLRVDFAAASANSIYRAFDIRHPSGNLCPGYNYTFSFGYQFTALASPAAPLVDPHGVSLRFTTSSCYAATNASAGPYSSHVTSLSLLPHPYWHPVNFTCLATNPRSNYITLSIATNGKSRNLTAFSVYIDNVRVAMDPVQGPVTGPKLDRRSMEPRGGGEREHSTRRGRSSYIAT